MTYIYIYSKKISDKECSSDYHWVNVAPPCCPNYNHLFFFLFSSLYHMLMQCKSIAFSKSRFCHSWNYTMYSKMTKTWMQYIGEGELWVWIFQKLVDRNVKCFSPWPCGLHSATMLVHSLKATIKLRYSH